MMTKYRKLFARFLPLAMIACVRIPFSEYALPEYDEQLEWVRVTKKADFQKRYNHAAAGFDNLLWIFGGYNPGQVID